MDYKIKKNGIARPQTQEKRDYFRNLKSGTISKIFSRTGSANNTNSNANADSTFIKNYNSLDKLKSYQAKYMQGIAINKKEHEHYLGVIKS